MIELGDARYDPESKLLYRGGEEIRLPPRAIGLLDYLLERPGKIVPKEELLASVWDDAVVGEESLTQAISQLRRVLDDDPQRPTYIQTVPRRGYRLIADVSSPEGGKAAGAFGLGKERTLGARLGVSLLAAAISALTVTIVLAAWGWLRTPEPASPIHLEINAPAGVEIVPTRGLAISSDGGKVVFAGRDGARVRLYMRRLGVAEAGVPLPSTEEARCPAFSPQGDWLAYIANGELRKMSVDDLSSFLIADVSGPPVGCAWGPDDRIYFSAGYRSPLLRIHSDGGEIERVTKLGDDPTEIGHRTPSFLPGGGLLYTAALPGGGDRIVATRGGTGASGLVLSGEFAHWVPGGYLAFLGPTPPTGWSSTTLMAAAFDSDRLEPIDSPAPVLQGIASAFAGIPTYDVAGNGTLVYAPAIPRSATLLRVDEAGSETVLTERRENYRSPAWSPDGSKLAVARLDADRAAEVWVIDVATGASYRLVDDGDHPAWSRDGDRIYFTNREGIHFVSPSGENPELVLATDHYVFLDHATPAGLLFTQVNPGTDGDLYLLDEDDRRRTVIQEQGSQWAGALSPDLRWFAMAHLGPEGIEVYVAPFPDLSPRWRVTDGGGTYPRWHPELVDTLYYETAEGVVSASLRMGAAAPSVDSRRVIYRHSRPQPLPRLERLYAVHPDGQSVAVVRLDTPPLDRLHVVLNWPQELRRLVPTGR